MWKMTKQGGWCEGWAEDVIGLIARPQRGQNCGQMYGQKCAQKEGAQNAFHPRGLSANRFWGGICKSRQKPTWRLATLIKSRILFNLSRALKRWQNRAQKRAPKRGQNYAEKKGQNPPQNAKSLMPACRKTGPKTGSKTGSKLCGKKGSKLCGKIHQKLPRYIYKILYSCQRLP